MCVPGIGMQMNDNIDANKEWITSKYVLILYILFGPTSFTSIKMKRRFSFMIHDQHLDRLRDSRANRARQAFPKWFECKMQCNFVRVVLPYHIIYLTLSLSCLFEWTVVFVVLYSV
jgi:hypothetical protein